MQSTPMTWPFGHLPSEQASREAKLLAELDLSRYTRNALLSRELKRYLLIRRTVGRPVTMQSKVVDAVWHAFILDTARYRAACDEIFGAYLDHVSDHFALDEAFPGLYEELFGETLPAVWIEREEAVGSAHASGPFRDGFDGNCA